MKKDYKPIMSFKRIMLAAVILHIVPLAFTVYREAIFNQVLPFLWILALPVVGYMLYKQKASVYAVDEQASSLLKVALTTVLVFSLFLMQYWFFAQMSLQVQPVMFTASEEAVLLAVPANETLAYIMRNGLQVWLFAIGVALCYNILPKVKASGFLAKRYDNLAVIAWLLDFAVMACLFFAVFTLMSLFVITLGGTIVTLAGAEQFLMPMLTVAVFILVLVMLNAFSGFHKKLQNRAKTKLSFASILFWQAAFAVAAWVIAAVFMTFLPESFLYKLYDPMYFPGIEVERFAQIWNFLILSWPFFLVPVLGVFMAKYATGQGVLKASLVFAAVPLILCLFVFSVLPSVASSFMHWQPALSFQEVALNNETARFYITPGSVIFMLSFLGLLLAMKFSKRFSQTIVKIMPDQFGRREINSRPLLARTFSLLVGFMMVYLILGAYSMSLAAAAYFLPILAAILLFYYKGICMPAHKAVQ